MVHKKNCVEIWEEIVDFPTYKIGEPDKNPMFLEKRVYQGSSGKVYPLPVIDKIYEEKETKSYKALFLENDYLQVMILPEIGGKIHRAIDKTNNYDFVYYNEVIKPALVGLVGPWVSGGIEFNWPQHHRPSTFMPVDYIIKENKDGSKTVSVSEVDRINGTKGMASFTLYPDKSYIEIEGQLYNPTSLPQTFLWWANPAVAVNNDTQSIFPPDVNAVFDHGKRDVSNFPIATGVYYKHDYGAGVDISRYKNIPVPTSYMAYKSDYNFVGGYDYGVEAGILHIADHHISPGKKQWTWGNGDFGQAWDRNLTDNNGPYIELMTGMFTDNQPDFTWLKPFEEKTFKQYFMPYKQAGNVKNASTEVVINLEVIDNNAEICVYATQMFKQAKIILYKNSKAIFEATADISPNDVIKTTIDIEDTTEENLTLSVFDETGRLMLSYTPKPEKIEKIPEPAKPAKEPAEIATNEELYLTALHIEQYRHATYIPDGYYLEGLKRDKLDIRINNAYGMLLLRRGAFAEAEKYFRNAIERLTWRNPNPYTSEPYYNLGVCLFYQNKIDEAYGAFYKATWSCEQQEMSFYYLAAIDTQKKNFNEALSHIERALIKNSRNTKARGLKTILLSILNKNEEAKIFTEESINIDPFDYVSQIEYAKITVTSNGNFLKLMRDYEFNFINTACTYMEYGCHEKAVEVLNYCHSEYPMISYYLAYNYNKINNQKLMQASLLKAADAGSLYCFPNTLIDLLVLEFAIENNKKDAKALYYLGNLYYDKRQYDKSVQLWEASVLIDNKFPTVHRNLALAYFNKVNDPVKARTSLERSFELDKSDARVFLELDQLYKKIGMSVQERFSGYEKYKEVILKRDDLCVEYATLLNLLGKNKESYNFIMARHFFPWEGGEGKVTAQYVLSLVEQAKSNINNKNYQIAIDQLNEALVYPHNLGEGKLEGNTDNNIYYYLGIAHKMLGNTEEAQQAFKKATFGNLVPAGAMFYNDQPADMIMYQGLAYLELDDKETAYSKFNKLISYGEKHMYDEVKIDYFAVSLPDLQLFDDNLNLKNKSHCYYLIGLGSYGKGDFQKAKESYYKTLEIENYHIGATIHNKLI